MVGGSFQGMVEFDKCIENAVVDDTTFLHLAGANGTRGVTLNNIRCTRPVYFNPIDFLTVNGGEFDASGIVGNPPVSGNPTLWGMNGPTRKMTFNSVRHYVTGSVSDRLLGNVSKSITVGTVAAGSFSITRTHYDAQAICTQLFEGAVLYDDTETPAFRLTKLPYLSGANMVFEGTFLKQITAGDVLWRGWLDEVTVNSPMYDGPYGHQVRTFSRIVPVDQYPIVINDDQHSPNSIRFSSRDWLPDVAGSFTYFIVGKRLRPTRVTINVERAYVGAGASQLNIQQYPGGTILASVDIKTTGRRVLDVLGNSTALGIDALTGLGTVSLSRVLFWVAPSPTPANSWDEAAWQVEIEGTRI